MLRSSLRCSFNSGSSSSLDCLTVMPLANTVSTRNLQGCRTWVIKALHFFNDTLMEEGQWLPLVHSLVAGTPSLCIHPFSVLFRGGLLSMENFGKSMKFTFWVKAETADAEKVYCRCRPCYHQRMMKVFHWVVRSQTPGCWRKLETLWTETRGLPHKAPGSV